MRSVETEGTTIDEAITRALELLHIERDKVDIEIIENSTRGLLGFGGKSARIRATVRNPLSASVDPPARVSQETGAAAVPLDVDAAGEIARRTLGTILDALGIAGEVHEVVAPDGVRTFRIPGEGAGIVIGRHGQTLDAIEYLLNRIVSRGLHAPFKIALDVESYRERRQETLEDTARRAADKARQTGRPVVLPPMSPRDRRTIHVTLGEERGVTTRSDGDGSFRRVIVVPDRAAGTPRA